MIDLCLKTHTFVLYYTLFSNNVLSVGCVNELCNHFLFLKNQQPDHLLDDAESAGRKLGNDRAEKESYLFRSLLDGNALVTFGSDWPVSM